MKLIAGGNFEPDGSLYLGFDGPVRPLGIERVQRVDVGTFHFHFSINTHRNGTHKYRWFVVSRSGSELAEVEWVKPKMAIIKFYSRLTGQLQDLNNGIHFAIVQDDEDEDDGAFLVVTSFNPDGTLNTSVPHPLGNFAKRGVAEAVLHETSTVRCLLDVDVGKGSCAWFAWREQLNDDRDLYPQMSQGGVREPWPDATEARRIDISWRTVGNETAAVGDIWHLAVCRFGTANPTDLRIVMNPAGWTVPIDSWFSVYPQVKQEGIWTSLNRDRNGYTLTADPFFTRYSEDSTLFKATEAGTGTITIDFEGLTYTTPPIAAA